MQPIGTDRDRLRFFFLCIWSIEIMVMHLQLIVRNTCDAIQCSMFVYLSLSYVMTLIFTSSEIAHHAWHIICNCNRINKSKCTRMLKQKRRTNCPPKPIPWSEDQFHLFLFCLLIVTDQYRLKWLISKSIAIRNSLFLFKWERHRQRKTKTARAHSIATKIIVKLIGLASLYYISFRPIYGNRY